VVGLLARSVGTIFIDRTNRKDVDRVIPLITEAMDGGRGVVLFAEGTSSAGAAVLPFRSSLLEAAVRAGFPVHCAALGYRVRHADRPAQLSVCWWGDMTFTGHLIELMQLREIRAQLTFGDKTFHTCDRKTLARQLWEAVNSLFVPTSEAGTVVVSGATVADSRNEHAIFQKRAEERCRAATR
jgi:1-acyl-sn-glycerol-3-phosphate acyltransferase